MHKRRLSSFESTQPTRKLLKNSSSPPVLNPYCPFLRLPTELRLLIYEDLVVANEPLQGETARAGKQYGLTLSIFRVNRQISAEARSLFLRKNTFFLSASPELSDEQQSLVHSSESFFDPPIHRDDWPELRHLRLNLLYYREVPGLQRNTSEYWRPVETGCATYIKSLGVLLRGVGPKLQSLEIVAELNESYCARRSLISFFMCERDSAFTRSLSSCTAMQNMQLHFEFPDCFYRVSVPPGSFQKRSILLVACNVLFCQAQARVDRLLACFENGRLKMPVKIDERIDLGPFVEKAFQNQQGLFLKSEGGVDGEGSK